MTQPGGLNSIEIVSLHIDREREKRESLDKDDYFTAGDPFRETTFIMALCSLQHRVKNYIQV